MVGGWWLVVGGWKRLHGFVNAVDESFKHFGDFVGLIFHFLKRLGRYPSTHLEYFEKSECFVKRSARDIQEVNIFFL